MAGGDVQEAWPVPDLSGPSFPIRSRAVNVLMHFIVYASELSLIEIALGSAMFEAILHYAEHLSTFTLLCL